MNDSPLEPGRLRIGDAERQQTADRLATAHALGQLDVDEFHERVEAAHAGRTQDDLDVLVRDLPGSAQLTDPSSGRLRGRARAAGAMLGQVPRAVWVVLAAALAALTIAAVAFDDGPREWRGGRGGPMGDRMRDRMGDRLGAGHAQVADHGAAWGFFGGALTVLGLIALAATGYVVVRRVRARRSRSHA
ncbi:DUF1707 SHOCT-like domain-containing protein [Cumulibacter manganitolerans]|uniref:DUF1707 SHOCT-like domain-containing protein n=1 Tax=Cumulibacter manganitolerans TaxID=1884992 RepID=UPI0012956160|nr:DUF1707 domain-containing protein [Cumulibacter manganitolerans]